METAENKRLVYEFGKFLLDPEEKILLSDGQPIHLPAKEFETLLLLVENNGRALSKEEMMSAIWQDSFVEESNLAKQISRLRKRFNANGGRFIETIPKHGYRFSADLRLIAQTVADEPVIVEKRTVKRLTVSVEKETEPEPLALPPARTQRYRWLVVVLPFLATIGLGYLAWHFSGTAPPAVDPYEPVRLTDDPLDDVGPSWTRDGRIRFHRLYSKDRHETLIMNADGSGQTELRGADGRRVLSWSPNEQKVLFQKAGDMTKTYLSNADGSGEVLLPFGAGGWSADSKMITYWARVEGHNFDIFTYTIETGESRNVTNSEAFDADPSFSPDGKSIVFNSSRDGNGEVYTIDVDGSNLRRLTFHPGTDSHPSFSPDGTAIMFNSDRENENGDVYLMRADGTGEPIKITNWDKSNETAGPSGWSPDGTKIAFTSDRNGNDDIYIMSAEWIRPKSVVSYPDYNIGPFSLSPDGKKIAHSTELGDKSGELRTFDRETERTTFLRKTDLPSVSSSWSPDGNKIAFHDRVGNTEICVINPDGSGFENITNDPSRDLGPVWSLDGKHLVFATSRGDPPNIPQLYLMNADGGNPRPLTPRKGWEYDAIWSPDGSLIFSCDRVDVPGNLMDICRIGADGSGEKRVLSHRDYDVQPAVSPDGSKIAFTALSDGNAEIYLMNSDGSGLFRLTRHGADDQYPKWSPDGKKLLFTSNRNGKFAIYEFELP